jgi:hypothetical protein
VKIDVKIDDAQLRRALDSFSKKQIVAASVRALNKSAVNVRTDAIGEVRKRRALKARTIREAFKIRRANRVKLQAEVAATGNPIPLRDYAARTTGAGVTVKVTNKGGRKLAVDNGRKGFQVASLGQHVFVRTGKFAAASRGKYAGKVREQIKKMYGPSIPTALTSEAVKSSLTRNAVKTVAKRLGEELRFELRRAGLGK